MLSAIVIRVHHAAKLRKFGKDEGGAVTSLEYCIEIFHSYEALESWYRHRQQSAENVHQVSIHAQIHHASDLAQVREGGRREIEGRREY